MLARTPFSARPRRVLAVIAHAGARRDAEQLQLLAWEQRRLPRHLGGGTGRDYETVGTAHAFAVQQRVDRHAFRGDIRSLQPILNERLELLAGRQARVDREATRRQAEGIVRAHAAKIAGPGEYQ